MGLLKVTVPFYSSYREKLPFYISAGCWLQFLIKPLKLDIKYAIIAIIA